MRIAFIDYVFSWPPLGGAPADLYYTIQGIQRLGHEVNLFFAARPTDWTPYTIDLESLPFSTSRLDFRPGEFIPSIATSRFREKVDAWRPDVVFQCFGFFMKPYVSEALAHYPQISRYYAYEPFCPRDYRIYKAHQTCPNNYLHTPKECLKCTVQNMWREIRIGDAPGYVGEFVATKAYNKHYYSLLTQSLRRYKSIIVYNHFTKDLLSGFSDAVHVIGGGVHLDEFAFTPVPERGAGEKKIIFMGGRADDASKGFKTFENAGEMLAEERNDFEMRVTHTDKTLGREWLKPLGWHKFSEVCAFYQESDICVVPSIWEEPFGLVAVEAMATGRPVVVSDVGGLQEIVVHGETGFIFHRDKPAELADYLRTLLDDPELRRRMGEAGRKRVEKLYAWDQVIDRHYPAILEAALR